MNTFDKIYNEHKDNLELYVPVVARVHGPTHPVFYEVKNHYDAIVAKLNQDLKSDLSEDFMQLRKVTDNYDVPSDTCETYEAVYAMLGNLDRAYFE